MLLLSTTSRYQQWCSHDSSAWSFLSGIRPKVAVTSCSITFYGKRTRCAVTITRITLIRHHPRGSHLAIIKLSVNGECDSHAYWKWIERVMRMNSGHRSCQLSLSWHFGNQLRAKVPTPAIAHWDRIISMMMGSHKEHDWALLSNSTRPCSDSCGS